MSSDYPVAAAYQSSLQDDFYDAFVSKLASTGSSLLYSTFLGGVDLDDAHGIYVENGQAFVAGWTASTDFPVRNAYQSGQGGETGEVFISKLSSSGSFLVYSTYLGGGGNDEAAGISVENGQAYVAGWTDSTDFPTMAPYQSSIGGGQDVFLSRLSSSGSSLIYSTYLGGSDADEAAGISVISGLAYLAGWTASSGDFPVINSYQSSGQGDKDVFVTKFSSAGSSLLYSTFLGGSASDEAKGIAVGDGCGFIAGVTYSGDFPTLNPFRAAGGFLQDAFVCKISSGGSSLVYSTYLGERTVPFQSRVQIESGDYNGDGTSDAGIFRRYQGLWSVRNLTRVYFGDTLDLPASADYNGDGTTDIAIFRAWEGLWSIRNLTRFYLGGEDDEPVPGDYNGDGSTEAAAFRRAAGLWALRNLTRIYLGSWEDMPIPGDYNGDGTKEPAIFRPSGMLWAAWNSTRFYFGSASDQPIQGDYEGDNTWEGAIFRPAAGLWAIRNLSRCYLGGSDDQPVQADYEGDGADDIGIFRDSTGLWSVKDLSRFYFGSTADMPVTR